MDKLAELRAALKWVEGQMDARLTKGEDVEDLETYANQLIDEIGAELEARGSLPKMAKPAQMTEESGPDWLA